MNRTDVTVSLASAWTRRRRASPEDSPVPISPPRKVHGGMPSRFDVSRTDSEVLAVTVTCSEDPREYVTEGDPVEFDGFTVGVMPPESGENGRIRGGKLFWQASGVRSRVPSGKS